MAKKVENKRVIPNCSKCTWLIEIYKNGADFSMCKEIGIRPISEVCGSTECRDAYEEKK